MTFKNTQNDPGAQPDYKVVDGLLLHRRKDNNTPLLDGDSWQLCDESPNRGRVLTECHSSPTAISRAILAEIKR